MRKEVVAVSLWKRVFAYFIDVVLLSFLVLSPLTEPLTLDLQSSEGFFQGFASYSTSYSSEYLLFAFVFAFFILVYFSVLECWFGQTVGKIILGIEVEGTKKKPVSLLQAIIRNITKLSGVLLTLDTLYLLWKRGEQRYFEVLSDTHVVEEVKRDA